MARLGGMSSETPFSNTSAGLGSILRDQKATSASATSSASGPCCNRANVLLGITNHPPTPPKALSLSSSPVDSSLLDLDLSLDLNLNLNVMGDDEPEEFKEEDIWAAETGSWEHLNLSEVGSHQHLYNSKDLNSELSLGKHINVSAHEFSLGLGYGKQRMVKEAKKSGVSEGANGNIDEVGIGNGKHKVASSVEVVRSSNTRRRDKSLGITDAFLNNSSVGLSPLSRVSEISVSGHGNARPSASWMIPQLAGGLMSKDPPRRHAERQSAPVQVPDWSKIMAKKAKGRKAGIINDDSDNEKGDDDDDEERLPPHELVAREYARSQRTTFSVCEGQGRTLKGRDLSRVRNAVWSQMGFAD